MRTARNDLPKFRAPEAPPPSPEVIAALMKAAKARRRRQNEKRKATWTGGVVKDVAALKRTADNERMLKEIRKQRTPSLVAPPVLIFNSRPNGPDKKGKAFKNVGKAAVRRQRKLRKAEMKDRRGAVHCYD